jgi:hypothetical protein
LRVFVVHRLAAMLAPITTARLVVLRLPGAPPRVPTRSDAAESRDRVLDTCLPEVVV